MHRDVHSNGIYDLKNTNDPVRAVHCALAFAVKCSTAVTRGHEKSLFLIKKRPKSNLHGDFSWVDTCTLGPKQNTLQLAPPSGRKGMGELRMWLLPRKKVLGAFIRSCRHVDSLGRSLTPEG